MRRSLDAKLALLVGLTAIGALACQSDPNKRVESARADVVEQNQTASNERAELGAEQRQERRELVQEQRQEQRELAHDQAEERKDEHGDIDHEQQEASTELQHAAVAADKQKQAYAESARARLRRIEQRAAKLHAQKDTAPPPARKQLNAALDGFPQKCNDAERDIDALTTIAARNWDQAKGEVDQELASLEQSLQSVESRQ